MKRLWLTIPMIVVALTTTFIVANRTDTPLPVGTKAELLVVEKGKRELSIYSGGRLLRSYRVALGRSPVGAKVREGDNRTPEGSYVIDWRNPNSGYHLSMHVSYPAASDTARGKAGGYSPGGAIMLHGLRKGLGWIGHLHTTLDWTKGCIALTNPEIDELWRVVPNGTPIHIKP